MNYRRWFLLPHLDHLARRFAYEAFSAHFTRVSATSKNSFIHQGHWVPLALTSPSTPLVFSDRHIRVPAVHRAYSQTRNPQGDQPDEGAPAPQPPSGQRAPLTGPPPLPVQPINIPGGPPATFSITNNPSLDAALTTVIGLGLGKYIKAFYVLYRKVIVTIFCQW
jgi:hypothetical protein